MKYDGNGKNVKKLLISVGLIISLLGMICVPDSHVYAAEHTEKTQVELGKDNETLPKKNPDDEIYGMPRLDSEEKKDYHTLQLRMTRSDQNEIRLTWNYMSDATGYELYGARCNTGSRRYKVALITDLEDPAMTAWMCLGLKENTYYKFVVRAYQKKNGIKTYLARSVCTHVPTAGDKYGTIQAVRVSDEKVKMAVGGSHTIKATAGTDDRKLLRHIGMRYESTAPDVVTVDGNGKLHAVKKGSADIYVYAPNGLYTMVSVNVR